MTDTTATINAKGLDATGITEDIAAELFHKVGTHLIAIVDLQVVDKHGPNVKGKRKVTLSIDGIEPALDDNLAEHLRELTRTLYYNRQVATNGPTLDGGDEPSVDQVLAAGAKHKPHPYLASTLSLDDDAVCDVCGQIEATAVHADRDQLDDPFTVTEADLDEAEEEVVEEIAEEDLDDRDPDEAIDEEYVDEGEWADQEQPVP